MIFPFHPAATQYRCLGSSAGGAVTVAVNVCTCAGGKKKKKKRAVAVMSPHGVGKEYVRCLHRMQVPGE